MSKYSFTTSESKRPTGANFKPVSRAGYYNVEVTSSKLEEYEGKKNPETGNKIRYLKIIPSMRVIDGDSTITINRFDMPISAIRSDNSFYDPKDPNKEGIWWLADSFLINMGAYVPLANGDSKLNLDTDFLRGRAVRALFRYETYCKTDSRWNMRPNQLDAWLESQGHSPTYIKTITAAELIVMFKEISKDNGYEESEDIRVKSVPVAFSNLSSAQAEVKGYFQLTAAYFMGDIAEYELTEADTAAIQAVEGVTFISKEDYETFVGLQALVADTDEDDDLGML